MTAGTPDPTPETLAEQTLSLMKAQGFDEAQVSLSHSRRSEVCVSHNEPSLLRSNESWKLQLVGLLDGRRAATEASDIDAEALQSTVQDLWQSVASAPQDAANALSSGQHARILRGQPAAQGAELAEIAGAMSELLAWRSAHTPTVMLEDSLAAHTHVQACTLTSGGSALHADARWFEAMVFGLAREDGHSSSFNYAGGACDSLLGMPVVERFDIQGLMRDLTRQVHTQPPGGRFVGSVVLTPRAVESLLGWLLGQLSDAALIDGSSVYRDSVGQQVTSPLLSLRSRFEGPGVLPFSADAFYTPPITILADGRLQCLTPSLYGSRKTGLPHVPVGGEGWLLDAGTAPRQALLEGVARGALVDRLSMGRPAANGDFSGVIKNSFAIEGGQVGPALSETMISGNVAQMLRDVQAVSRERVDMGGSLLPWLRVDGLHFS